MSHTGATCTCGGELAIVGEVREGVWRTGFKLACKKCGKKWTYAGGFYRQEAETTRSRS